MRLSVGLSAYLNNFSQPLAADVGLHGFMKRLYGKLVPFYRLRLGGECAASNAGLTLLGPEIPVVRATAAIARIEHTFTADAGDGEAFVDWVCRKQLPFFTELLDDFLQVSPSDLPELLADFAGKQDFVAIMLDALPQEEKRGDQVAALLDEARSEALFRDSLLSDGQLQQAAACNENILDLAAKAAIHAHGRLLMIEGALQLPLTRALPHRSDLTDAFMQLRQQLGYATSTQQLQDLSGAVDRWLLQIEALCGEARPLSINDFIDLSREPAPMAFLKIKQRLLNGAELNTIKLANSDAVEAIVSGLKSLGVELVSRLAAPQEEHVLLVLKKSEQSGNEHSSVH